MKDYCKRHKSRQAKREEWLGMIGAALFGLGIGSIFFFAR
jgi:hypothetical protein